MSRKIAERPVLAGAVQPDRGGNGNVVHPFAPRLEMMIARSKALSPRLAQIVGVLLDAAHPFRSGGRDVLHPLWAQEAMQRAYGILHLAVQLQQKIGACAEDDITARSEQRRANDLAVLFRTLHIEQDEEVLRCSDVLRGIVRNLVALFGSGAGRIVIRTDIEQLSLPAYKRRALVLAASELVINALRDGFAGKVGGRIDVTLWAVAPRTCASASLTTASGCPKPMRADKAGSQLHWPTCWKGLWFIASPEQSGRTPRSFYPHTRTYG
jgi:hypothetical protein